MLPAPGQMGGSKDTHKNWSTRAIEVSEKKCKIALFICTGHGVVEKGVTDVFD